MFIFKKLHNFIFCLLIFPPSSRIIFFRFSLQIPTKTVERFKSFPKLLFKYTLQDSWMMHCILGVCCHSLSKYKIYSEDNAIHGVSLIFHILTSFYLLLLIIASYYFRLYYFSTGDRMGTSVGNFLSQSSGRLCVTLWMEFDFGKHLFWSANGYLANVRGAASKCISIG